MADEFSKLPVAMAPRNSEDPKKYPGKYVPVVLMGQPMAMSMDAVKERFAAKQNIQLTTWGDVESYNAGERVGRGVGGTALAAGAGAANGILLNMGVMLTHAALKALDPGVAKSFQQGMDDIESSHRLAYAGGELAGAFHPFPGKVVGALFNASRGAVGAIAGAKVAEAVGEAARLRQVAQEAQAGVGGATRGAEAAALKGGIPAQRARAFMQGEGAGVPEAIAARRGAAAAEPITGLPEPFIGPEALRGTSAGAKPAGVAARASSESPFALRQQIEEAKGIVKASPGSVQAQHLEQVGIPNLEKKLAGAVGGEVPAVTEELAASVTPGMHRAPTRAGVGGEAAKMERKAQKLEELGEGLLARDAEVSEARAAREAADAAKAQSPEEIELLKRHRAAEIEAPYLAEQKAAEEAAQEARIRKGVLADAEDKALGKAAGRAGRAGLEAEESLLSAERNLIETGTPAKGGIVSEQQARMRAIREATAAADAKTGLGEAAAAGYTPEEYAAAHARGVSPKGAYRYNAEGKKVPFYPTEEEARAAYKVAPLRRGAEHLAGEVAPVAGDIGKLGEGTMVPGPQAEGALHGPAMSPEMQGNANLAGQIEEMRGASRLPRQYQPETAMDVTRMEQLRAADPGLAMGLDMQHRQQQLEAARELARGEAAGTVVAEQGPLTEGVQNFGEAMIPEGPGIGPTQDMSHELAGVYRQHPEAWPEEMGHLFKKDQATTALQHVKTETLLTQIEKIEAAKAQRMYEVAQARADGMQNIAKGIGTVPAALDPEFLARAFIDGAGSRLTYDTIHDKAHTFPGVVGSGVMAAVAAAGLHAGIGAAFGSKASREMAKVDEQFQKAIASNDPKQVVSFMESQLSSAVLRQAGLDTRKALASMENWAGGPQHVAEVLVHQVPKMVGKTSLSQLKLPEFFQAVEKGLERSGKGIGALVKKMDDASAMVGAAKAAGGTPGWTPTNVAQVADVMFEREAQHMATRMGRAPNLRPGAAAGSTVDVGGPEAAKAARNSLVEFLRMQGAIDEGLIQQGRHLTQAARKSQNLPAGPDFPSKWEDLTDINRFDAEQLKVFLKKDWESMPVSYEGLRHTASEMGKKAYGGQVDPTVIGDKRVYEEMRGMMEDTLFRDMDSMWKGQGEKYLTLKRNYQAWKYIKDGVEQRMVDQLKSSVGSEDALKLITRGVFTSFAAWSHPVGAAAAAATFIMPALLKTGVAKRGVTAMMEKLAGGLHVDNKRLAVMSAIEKGVDEYLALDLAKIGAGRTKVTGAHDVYQSLLAARALAQNPHLAQTALQKQAEAAGTVSQEFAAETLSRTQQAIAIMSQYIPRAMKSDSWGSPDEPHLRIDPWELKRWENVYSGLTNPLSALDDLKMGGVPTEKMKVIEQGHPEFAEQLKQTATLKTKAPKGKISPKTGEIKMPKFHYDTRSAMRGLVGAHADMTFDVEHMKSMQDTYQQLAAPPQGGGGGGMPASTPNRNAPFGAGSGLATESQMTSRRA